MTGMFLIAGWSSCLGVMVAVSSWGELPWGVKFAAVAAAVALGLMVLLWFVKQMVLNFISESVSRIGSSFFGSLFGGGRRELQQLLRTELAGPSSGIDAGAEHKREVEDLRARIADLQRFDPGFSLEKFKDQAATTLAKLLEAIEKKDLALVREFVTPTLYQRLGLQVDELVKKRWARNIDRFEVQSVGLTAARHDGPYFQLTVLVQARGIDYTAEEATEIVIAGSRGQRSREYVMTFLRPENQKTALDPAAPTSSHCPNCGAPLKLTALGRCDYCDTQVVSGRFSWTLSEFGGRD